MGFTYTVITGAHCETCGASYVGDEADSIIWFANHLSKHMSHHIVYDTQTHISSEGWFAIIICLSLIIVVASLLYRGSSQKEQKVAAVNGDGNYSSAHLSSLLLEQDPCSDNSSTHVSTGTSTAMIGDGREYDPSKEASVSMYVGDIPSYSHCKGFLVYTGTQLLGHAGPNSEFSANVKEGPQEFTIVSDNYDGRVAKALITVVDGDKYAVYFENSSLKIAPAAASD